ncbi:siderophore-interacting protein [Antribacter gilvus]|uniref:siderophore-interacting protein n=1 Tax=Antribacter gilvus TaxID=2304675 RepID=UPI000F7B89D9|nr:siderophore-interacting protein [Antribacter gilvus]
MGYKGRKAVDPHVMVAEVVSTKQVTPGMVRVTLGGEGIAALTLQGYDQWFRLFLGRPGQDMLRLPTRTSNLGWYAQYLATPKPNRPWVRSYTIRAARPDLDEIDVDFVVHTAEDGAVGPGCGFATGCSVGDQVGILDQGVGYNPRHEHDWTLLVADESGLPAVAGICESLPESTRGLAIIEVATDADRQEFRTPAGVEVRWVLRDSVHDDGRAAIPSASTGVRAEAGTTLVAEVAEDAVGHHAVPGAAALEALRAAELLDGTVYAYAIGESSLATGARRHLVNERGVPKAHVDFVGYWRQGHAAQ